jgi:hypothetical protein
VTTSGNSGPLSDTLAVEIFVETPVACILCILGILGAAVIYPFRQIGQGRRHALS